MGILDRFRLDGYGCVVTGSGRGIGRGIALGLAEAGAGVVVTARRADDLEGVAAQIRDRGRRAVVVAGDVRAEGFADRLAEAALGELGRLDVWVNNVGGSDEKRTRPLLDTPDDIFRAQLELNLTTAFQGAKAAASRMVAGASIVNISSGAGMRAAPNTGPYGAAKAGMINLTQTMAAELAAQGIRVNAVSPGMVPTDAFFEVLHYTEEMLPAAAAQVPLGRLGEPEDIAAAVIYLVSEAGSWVTGQNLFVSGGREGGRSAEHHTSATMRS